MRAKRLDEFFEALLEPVLERLGLQNLEINGLYIVYGLLTITIYGLAIWAHLQARRARMSGKELTEKQEDFLGWVTASSITPGRHAHAGRGHGRMGPHFIEPLAIPATRIGSCQVGGHGSRPREGEAPAEPMFFRPREGEAPAAPMFFRPREGEAPAEPMFEIGIRKSGKRPAPRPACPALRLRSSTARHALEHAGLSCVRSTFLHGAPAGGILTGELGPVVL